MLIPQHMLDNQQEKRTILERIRRLLIADFSGANLSYQITASYYLVNRNTGVLQLWEGSFFTGGNQVAVVQDFQRFEEGNFVAKSMQDTLNPEAKLHWRGPQTVWEFHSLVSLIFNCQASVSSNFKTLYNRDLHPKGNSRRHVTFALS